MNTNEQQATFSGWAKVEIMGHQSHIGEVTTQTFGGTVFFRVDRPMIADIEETITESTWMDGQRIHAGSVIRRGEIPAASVLIGAGSIYRIIPCDESAAIEAIRRSVPRPLFVVKLAEPKQIEESAADGEDYEAESVIDDTAF